MSNNEKVTQHKLRVFSRHPSHDVLRNNKLLFPFLACVRLGSTTQGNLKYDVEINSIRAIEISANKRLMKQKFEEGDIATAIWYENLNDLMQNINDVKFPIVAKNIFGSRGTGNYLLQNRSEIENWVTGRNVHNYIFEQYYSYNREYRLHVTKNGCFYTCRKMLTEDTPKEKRWYRNDSNSIWVVEDNPVFDKPTNWELIVENCVIALDCLGLDIAAFDVRVQSSKNQKEQQRKSPAFIIIESNSAPSFGEITSQKYLEILPSLITEKFESKKVEAKTPRDWSWESLSDSVAGPFINEFSRPVIRRNA
jgi:RimK-like ATP-grasp domain